MGKDATYHELSNAESALREYCACGRPLHYANPQDQALIESIIERAGPDAYVQCDGRIWLVPRHYMALHPHHHTKIHTLGFPQILSDKIVRVRFKYDRGTVDLPMDRHDYTKQRFTHVDTTGQIRHFYVPKLAELIQQANWPLTEVGITPADIEHVMTNNGIEPDFLPTISAERLAEPGIGCKFSDGTTLMVDGSHRYVRRFQVGLPFMQFWVVPERLWRKSLLNMFGLHQRPGEFPHIGDVR